MPGYVTSVAGNNPVALLQPGVPGYAFGSIQLGQTCLFQITRVAITSNVATITGTVREGNIPSVAQLITIRGTATVGGAFNVTNISISTVSIIASTGTGTITFALTHADVAPTTDAGQAYIPVEQLGEALANGSSQAFAIQDISGHNTNGLTVTWSTQYSGSPSTVTMTLQAAIDDIDAEYQALDSSTNTSGEERFITLTRFRFVRVTASNVTGGTAPKSIVKLLI